MSVSLEQFENLRRRLEDLERSVSEGSAAPTRPDAVQQFAVRLAVKKYLGEVDREIEAKGFARIVLRGEAGEKMKKVLLAGGFIDESGKQIKEILI